MVDTTNRTLIGFRSAHKAGVIHNLFAEAISQGFPGTTCTTELADC